MNYKPEGQHLNYFAGWQPNRSWLKQRALPEQAWMELVSLGTYCVKPYTAEAAEELFSASAEAEQPQTPQWHAILGDKQF